ncbi:hypothetical protein C8R44DRAFT_895137 [Mycena epipterygia]|nr:hypothetical protein C8R44DRAFT_895137 [Mycena epipterygia]
MPVLGMPTLLPPVSLIPVVYSPTIKLPRRRRQSMNIWPRLPMQTLPHPHPLLSDDEGPTGCTAVDCTITTNDPMVACFGLLVTLRFTFAAPG